MATINGASYLREQFSSILNQLHPEEELIISGNNYYIADIYLYVIAFGLLYFLIGSLRIRLFQENKQGHLSTQTRS
jgi:hypothetical protein